MPARQSIRTAYRQIAAAAAETAHVPFSGRKDAVVLVMADGGWLPGVRIESAAFSLTIPPLLNAATTAVALSTGPVQAAVASRTFNENDCLYAKGMHLLADLARTEPDILGVLPKRRDPGARIDPFLAAGRSRRMAGQEDPAVAAARPGSVAGKPSSEQHPAGAAVCIAMAREIGQRAHVPESEFPVGCLLEIGGRGCIPGVNVEHKNWMHILCAERNALGTAVSYGFEPITALYLTCLRDEECTPCGACRQLIAELAPASTLWMDRGDRPPASSTPGTLLPGYFAGIGISRDT